MSAEYSVIDAAELASDDDVFECKVRRTFRRKKVLVAYSEVLWVVEESIRLQWRIGRMRTDAH